MDHEDNRVQLSDILSPSSGSLAVWRMQLQQFVAQIRSIHSTHDFAWGNEALPKTYRTTVDEPQQPGDKAGPVGRAVGGDVLVW